ncbi:hypothetical protein, partial [Streptomyces sp. NPDC003832]
RLGAAGAAGDLFVDGALGSHTACLHRPYADENYGYQGLLHTYKKRVLRAGYGAADGRMV